MHYFFGKSPQKLPYIFALSDPPKHGNFLTPLHLRMTFLISRVSMLFLLQKTWKCEIHARERHAATDHHQGAYDKGHKDGSWDGGRGGRCWALRKNVVNTGEIDTPAATCSGKVWVLITWSPKKQSNLAGYNGTASPKAQNFGPQIHVCSFVLPRTNQIYLTARYPPKS